MDLILYKNISLFLKCSQIAAISNLPVVSSLSSLFCRVSHWHFSMMRATLASTVLAAVTSGSGREGYKLQYLVPLTSDSSRAQVRSGLTSKI